MRKITRTFGKVLEKDCFGINQAIQHQSSAYPGGYDWSVSAGGGGKKGTVF